MNAGSQTSRQLPGTRRSEAVHAGGQGSFSAARIGLLALGVIAAAILSLGVHDLAIEHLGVPYPNDDAVPTAVKLLNEALRLAAVVLFCRLARPFLDRYDLVVRAVLVGWLIAALDEALRVVVIDWVILDGWHGLNAVYVVLDRMPAISFSFFRGAMAAVIAQLVWPRAKWRLAAAIIGASLVNYLVLLPLIKAAVPAILYAASVSEPAPRYLPPYDWRMLPYIYGLFVEPMIAAVAMAALTWKQLGRNEASRIGLFVPLLLIVRGRVISQFLYIFWLKPPLPSAIAAEAQFFLETALMATLAGFLWAWTSRGPTAFVPRRSPR